MSTPTSSSTGPVATLTTVFSTMISVVPVMCLVGWFVLADDGLGDYPDTWVPLAVGVLAVAAYSFCELAGFRTEPLQPSTAEPADVGGRSYQRFVASSYVRFAICESVFLLSFVLGFTVDSFWPVLVGTVFTIPLLVWEVWPGARNRRRFATSLEGAGAPSYLEDYATGRI